MATKIVPGPRTWSMQRDEDGHRTYKIKHLIVCDSTDGPANALRTPGLPQPGSTWRVDADSDQWAWCRFDATVNPVKENEPNRFFEVEQTFSTKPYEKGHCREQEFEDPILEPQKVSGSFKHHKEEAARDRKGKLIATACGEQIRGPAVEFDSNKPTVQIEQNVPRLGIELFAPMVDTVNKFPLWGFPRRCIKLSSVSWERKFYGFCYVYYTRSFEFEIDARRETDSEGNQTGVILSGFDRRIPSEGTKVLKGTWDTDPNSPTYGRYKLSPDVPFDGENPAEGAASDPKNVCRFQDWFGNTTRTLLDSQGFPANAPVLVHTAARSAGPVQIIVVEKYDESDFLLLGIPLVF